MLAVLIERRHRVHTARQAMQDSTEQSRAEAARALQDVWARGELNDHGLIARNPASVRSGPTKPVAQTPMRPWETGDEDQRWQGYLQSDREVLRNKLGLTTVESLRMVEDRLVEARALTLTSKEGLRISYHLEGFQAAHRWLFADVYEWQGS